MCVVGHMSLLYALTGCKDGLPACLLHPSRPRQLLLQVCRWGGDALTFCLRSARLLIQPRVASCFFFPPTNNKKRTEKYNNSVL